MTDRPEREVEGLIERLKPNLHVPGFTVDEYLHPDGGLEPCPVCQYFAAQAGPYDEGTPVVVMSTDEAEQIADALRTLTAERGAFSADADKGWDEVDELRELATTLNAEREQLEARLRIARRYAREGRQGRMDRRRLEAALDAMGDEMDERMVQLDRLEAENERLREAIRPFAEHAAFMEGYEPTDGWDDIGDATGSHMTTVADYFRAARALEPETEE